MTRRFAGETLVIASHNAGKVREIAALLQPHGVEVRSAAALGLAEPEETGTTFAENAAIKAAAAARAAGLPALADDSGLVVPALGGAPGVRSARWAGEERDFRVAMERVNDALGRTGDRTAWFTCVLAFGWPDGHLECFEGRVTGTLTWPPRGDRGFGYDPMFVPDGSSPRRPGYAGAKLQLRRGESGYGRAGGHALTFGEMDPDAKHEISHRARAFDKLIAACFDGGRP